MRADDANDNGPAATPSKKVTLVAKGGDEVNCVLFETPEIIISGGGETFNKDE